IREVLAVVEGIAPELDELRGVSTVEHEVNSRLHRSLLSVSSCRLPGCECVAEHLIGARLLFAGRAGECVDRRADLHVGEASVLEHLLPTRTGQPPGDSAGPEIDIAQCFGW